MITISVGANKLFVPLTRVNVLECADAGGKVSNLPTDVSACDEGTIQANSIIVLSNGGFAEKLYPVFSTPDVPLLGESRDTKPICNMTHKCVLYIGENQEDFTQAKVFSLPFRVRPTRGY